MSKRKIVFIVVGVLTILIIIGLLWYRQTQPPKYDLKVGHKYRYDLAYKQESSTFIEVPNGDANSYATTLSCTFGLNLFPLQRTEKGYTIALTMMPSGDCSFQFTGKDLFSETVRVA